MDAAWVDASGADGLGDRYTEDGDTVAYTFKVCLFTLARYLGDESCVV